MNDLILGCAQLGMSYGITRSDREGVEFTRASRILQCAQDLGVEALDTAPGYGKSEEYIGRFGAAGFRVFTKVSLAGMEEGGVGEAIEISLSGSSDRMGTRCFEGILIHDPWKVKRKVIKEASRYLKDLKKVGRIRSWGYSIYSLDEWTDEMGASRPDFIQAPLSLADRRMLEEEVVASLKREGIRFIARSIFLQGLLLVGEDKLPQYFQPLASRWAFFRRWLRERELDAHSICLSYVRSCGVDGIVVGVQNCAELEQIAKVHPYARRDFPSCFDDLERKYLDARCWS